MYILDFCAKNFRLLNKSFFFLLIEFFVVCTTGTLKIDCFIQQVVYRVKNL